VACTELNRLHARRLILLGTLSQSPGSRAFTWAQCDGRAVPHGRQRMANGGRRARVGSCRLPAFKLNLVLSAPPPYTDEYSAHFHRQHSQDSEQEQGLHMASRKEIEGGVAASKTDDGRGMPRSLHPGVPRLRRLGVCRIRGPHGPLRQLPARTYLLFASKFKPSKPTRRPPCKLHYKVPALTDDRRTRLFEQVRMRHRRARRSRAGAPRASCSVSTPCGGGGVPWLFAARATPTRAWQLHCSPGNKCTCDVGRLS
jgi:hypothetical protein